MARIVIREQDLTGNRVDQDFTDIAFIPGFVKYPSAEYSSPQLCYTEEEFIDKFGNEPAIAYSKFMYNVKYEDGTKDEDDEPIQDDVLNPETGTTAFFLNTDEVESVSDSAYHYARELLYRGLPIYYAPVNEKIYRASDESGCSKCSLTPTWNGELRAYDGTQNESDPKAKMTKASDTIVLSSEPNQALVESEASLVLDQSLEPDIVLLPGEGLEAMEADTPWDDHKEVSEFVLTFDMDARAKNGQTIAYQWYKIEYADDDNKIYDLADDEDREEDYEDSLKIDGATEKEYKADGSADALYYCVAKAVRNDAEEATFRSQVVAIDTKAFEQKFVVLDSNSSQRTANFPQSSVEKLLVDAELLDEDGNIKPEVAVTAGIPYMVLSKFETRPVKIHTQGTNVESFAYKWYVEKKTEDGTEETLISTSKICNLNASSLDAGIYTLRVEVTAVPTNAYVLDTIVIKAPTTEGLTMSKILAAAKAKAINAAIEVTHNTFTKQMLDYFSNNENTELIKDRGLYNFKYMTTGGYPLFEAATLTSDGTSKEFTNWKKALSNLLEVCGQKTVDDSKDYIDESGSVQRQGRGDCILLVDHQYDKCQDTMELYEEAREYFEDPANVNDETLEFAAMFTPWCNYGMTYTSHNVDVNLPASFAYLSCLADSIQAYDNWHAISGVARGTVKNINEVLLVNPLTNTKANKCQADPETAEKGRISINCITEVKPYGQVIWGNRTLQKADAYKHVTAMGFLNLRNEVSDIKKLVYRAARRWMFEQNTSVLWVNFKSTITPLLERMVNGYGLSRYEIRKGVKTKKHKLYAEIRIWPIYAVEYIDVTIQILDEETIVTEE